VNLVGPVPAALAGIVLFLVPGLTVLLLLRPEDRQDLSWDETAFLSVALSVSAAAWVGLVLGEAGRFHIVTAALLLGGASIFALWRRRAHLGWPRLWPHTPRDAAPAAAVLGLALAFQAYPSEHLVGGRDPGLYVAAMGIIGRTGAIAYTDPVVLSIPAEDRALFYRHPENPDYSWGRFMGYHLERPETGRVVPQFFHLFPAFGAFLFQSMGAKGALATPCVFGVLGTLAFFFAWRRLFGPAPALLGALLLGLNVVQVWFARYPMSEPMSQFLLFLGLFAFALWEERGAPAFGALAGTALGLSLLVRIDNLLLVGPLALYVLARRAHGALPWARLRPLVLPFTVLALHAFLHAAFWARKYLHDIATRPYWYQPAPVWLIGASAVAAVLLLAHRLERPLLSWMDTHGALLRRAAMALVVAAACFAYFVRPALSAWAGGDGNLPGSALVDPGLLKSLGYSRLAAHDAQSLLRLGWFVTPLGLVLAVLGLLVLFRHWRGAWLFPVLLGLTFAVFYLYKIRVYNDYFFALRRFVPVVLPFVIGLSAVFLCRLARAGGLRRGLAAALALVLAGAFLRDTWPLRRFRDWNHAVRFVGDMARLFGRDDVVIFEQPRSIHLLSLPLWALHGVNALELARANPDPQRLQHLVSSWRGQYRNVYFVHTYSTDLCGLFLERVQERSFGTFEWERGYGRKPRGPEPRAFHFRVSRVVPPEDLQVPPLDTVDVGGSDDVQVSGFHDKEGGGDHTYRWTGSCGSVYVPGVRGAAEIGLVASVGVERPRDRPVTVRVSLDGTPLGTFVAGPDWQEHRLPIRQPPAGPLVLRLDVPAWRPANVLPGSVDHRDLGVMVDRIRLLGAKDIVSGSPTSGGGP
jgi:hypothetical protein